MILVNEMTLPTVSISPSVQEYYEGDRIELTCTTTGNPAPRITWQRAVNRPLPRSSVSFDALLIIDNASVGDSGEYRCACCLTYFSKCANKKKIADQANLHPHVFFFCQYVIF